MWKNCLAKSLSIIGEDLNKKVPTQKNAFFCSFLPSELSRPRDIYYFVTEYQLSTKARPRAKFLATTSYKMLSLLDFPEKDRVEIVPHEIPAYFYSAKYKVEMSNNITAIKRKKKTLEEMDKQYLLFVSDAQARKNPKQWKEVFSRVRRKVVAVVPKHMFNAFNKDAVLYEFGSLSNKDMINLYSHAIATSILSGGAGVGLPALEGAYSYAPPIGNYYDVLSEVFPDNYIRRHFSKGVLRESTGFIPNAKYIYYEIRDPVEVAQLLNNAPDMSKEEIEELSDYVEKYYGVMTQYKRFLFT
jgi:hypothetical protein